MPFTVSPGVYDGAGQNTSPYGITFFVPSVQKGIGLPNASKIEWGQTAKDGKFLVVSYRDTASGKDMRVKLRENGEASPVKD